MTPLRPCPRASPRAGPGAIGGSARVRVIICGPGGVYRAAELLRGVRVGSGYGSLCMEQEHLSLALDGGVSLTGGMCGELAECMQGCAS